MKQEISVGFAMPEECPVLGRIMARSFRTAFAPFITEETLDRCAVAENCAGLLASLPEGMTTVSGRVDGELMGLLVYSEGEIEAIHSLPESWGTGLGKAMLDFALERMPKGKTVGLWAFGENARARRFYEKHGFAFTGESRVSEFDGAREVRYERKL